MGLLTNPRQTILVTCRARANVMGKAVEKDNAMTLDWHMPVSFKPQLYAIAVGKTRFSRSMIQESSAFIVNFMPIGMKDKVLYCGRHSGEHTDKIKEAGLETHEAENIDGFRIVGAIGYLECEVVQEIETGDHIIFIGKVVHAELVKEGKRMFHVDMDEFTTTE